MPYYILFWIFIGLYYTLLYYFWDWPINRRPSPDCCFFCLFQFFAEKEYQTEYKRNETFGNVIFQPNMIQETWTLLQEVPEAVTRAEGAPLPRGPPEGHRELVCHDLLVGASAASWLALQVLWITFIPKITLPKVSFRLDSVWYSFSLKYWNRQKKQQYGLGLRLVG